MTDPSKPINYKDVAVWLRSVNPEADPFETINKALGYAVSGEPDETDILDYFIGHIMSDPVKLKDFEAFVLKCEMKEKQGGTVDMTCKAVYSSDPYRDLPPAGELVRSDEPKTGELLSIEEPKIEVLAEQIPTEARAAPNNPYQARLDKLTAEFNAPPQSYTGSLFTPKYSPGLSGYLRQQEAEAKRKIEGDRLIARIKPARLSPEIQELASALGL